MTVHHLVREPDFVKQCPYCNREAKPTHMHKWRSEFHWGIHYKTLVCNCGKELRVKVGFHGSGHDSWNKKKKESLDDKVKVIEKYKVVEK